jgi:hypothetical protein
MKNTENIDDLIKKTLTEEEAAFYHELDDQNLPQMITGLFKGKLAWLTALLTVMMLIIFAAGVYCAVKFFEAGTVEDMLKWGVGIFISFAAIAMLKLYNFIQIYANKISREIKRIEFQIALLSEKEKV